MADHPCPFPKKRWWRYGRVWVCSCGKGYWLVEEFVGSSYFDTIRYLDDGSYWRWLPVNEELVRKYVDAY